jgi:hypothetical protein
VGDKEELSFKSEGGLISCITRLRKIKFNDPKSDDFIYT